MINNQKEAKLNASIADFIDPLRKQLENAKEVFKSLEMVEIIDQIIRKVEETNSSIENIQNWDREQTGHYGKIERQIEYWIDENIERISEMNESTIMTELKDICDKLSHTPRKKESDLPLMGKIPEVPESSNRSYQENNLSMDFNYQTKGCPLGESQNMRSSHVPRKKESDLPLKGKALDLPESSNGSYEESNLSMDLEDKLKNLDAHTSLCLCSLGIFPENAILKKRFVIYWWTGLGLLPRSSWKETEKLGENIFYNLVNESFLNSVHIREHNKVLREPNKVLNLCTINPTIYKWLFSPNKREDIILPFFGDWFNEKVLVNLDQRYLNSKDITSKPNLQVVQIGNWRSTEAAAHNRVEETRSKETMSDDHIEVDETDFLKNLREKAIYISLRGISGIEGVHESIGKLENLMILDLRACHNLDKLPQNPSSAVKQNWFKKLIGRKLPKEIWFKNLMVLDISECYLLDYMPKWICELSNLEVLKGFVVGGTGNKNQLCRLVHLSKLNKLRKLTIRISGEHLITEDFSGLKSLQSLLVLTIIWGENESNSTIPVNCFPDNLEKLDFRCYPNARALELESTAELKNMSKLYIRGGKLTTIPCNEKWEVKILRLRFLKGLLQTDWNDVRSSFKNLKYVEYVECNLKPKNFPSHGNSWSNENEEPSENADASVTSNQS